MATLTKDDILEAISNMTVIELKELLDAFEEKFDVTAAAPVAVAAAAPAGGGGDAAAEDEKDEFDVVLASAGPQKIQVVKVVKDLLGVGLKDAKDLVDAAPKADPGKGHARPTPMPPRPSSKTSAPPSNSSELGTLTRPTRTAPRRAGLAPARRCAPRPVAMSQRPTPRSVRSPQGVSWGEIAAGCLTSGPSFFTLTPNSVASTTPRLSRPAKRRR